MGKADRGCRDWPFAQLFVLRSVLPENGREGRRTLLETRYSTTLSVNGCGGGGFLATALQCLATAPSAGTIETGRNNEGMQQRLRWYELRECAEVKDASHGKRMYLVVRSGFAPGRGVAGGW